MYIEASADRPDVDAEQYYPSCSGEFASRPDI
jgi:hypothetical protein